MDSTGKAGLIKVVKDAESAKATAKTLFESEHNVRMLHGDGEVDFAVDVHGLFNEEHTDVVFGFEQGLGGGLGAFGVLHDLDEPGLAAPAAQHLRLEYARKSYLRKCAVQFVHAAYQYALRGRQAFFAEGFLRLIFKQLHGSSFWKRMPPAARGLGPLDPRRGA